MQDGYRIYCIIGIGRVYFEMQQPASFTIKTEIVHLKILINASLHQF